MFNKFYGYKIKVYDGENKCVSCGKSHKHIFEINDKKYGIGCAKKVLGITIKAHTWLYEIANKYIEEELKDYPLRRENPDEPNFTLGFWEYGGGISWLGDQSEHALWSKTVVFCDKKVNVLAQNEIHEYLKYAFYNYK